jgi:outer membrane protein assembly factor BamB
MLATLGDQRQILIFDAGGLAGHDTDGGAELWRVPWPTQFDINVAQPLVLDGGRVLITSASGACLIAVEGSASSWLPKELWRNRLLKCSYANPVARQGYVYGLDEGILACIDVATGKRQWKSGKGRYGHGQLLLSGDLLVILSEQGELVLVEATPEEHRELARLQAIDGKTWNCPVLVNGRAFIRNHMEMACYDLRPTADRSAAPSAIVEATSSHAPPVDTTKPAEDKAADDHAAEAAK